MAKKYWTYKGKKIPVKKYYPPTKKTSEQQYRELVRKVGQANKRLRAIKNEFGTLGWAGEILKDKTAFHMVDGWRGSRGVKINKKMTKEQQKAVLKSINNFLKSKTSTIKGFKRAQRLQIESLRVTFSKDDVELTNKEAKALYDRFENKDYDTITQYIKASDLNVLLDKTRTEHDTYKQFMTRTKSYIGKIVDEDVRTALKNVYKRYGDSDYETVTSIIKTETLNTIIDEAKEQKDTLRKFITRVEVNAPNISINNIRKELTKIYNNYVRL